MHRLFNLRPDANVPVMYASNWNTIRRGLEQMVRKTIGYYRLNPMAVKSDHFLVRLLQSISVSMNIPTERYYDNVDGLALNLSMALGMTSGIYPGRIHRGVFYGNDGPEILMAIREDFDPVQAEALWENLMPVRVLRHPVSDLHLLLPDGKAATSEMGFSVIEINIPLLAIQYRAFQKDQLNRPNKDDSPLSIMQFIHMYVLPNMLFSHLDYALFNRIYYKAIGRPLGEAERRHSFSMLDYTKAIDVMDDSILSNLAHVKRDFTGILRNVPAFFRSNMDVVMALPDVAETRQIQWALYLTRLPALHFMIKASNQDPRYRNGQALNYFKRLTTNLMTNSVLKSVLDHDANFDAQMEMEEIDQLLTA